MIAQAALAPEWQTTRWFNVDAPLSLAELRGKVVVLHAFQMLCPGCVSHGLPQARSVAQQFDPGELVVVGLHTVFEHHAVMTEQALQVFIHEYRLEFPIAVDRPAPDGGVPLTMRAYGLRGTPSLLLIDRGGVLRLHEFGRIADLALGAAIGQLLAERTAGAVAEPPATPPAG
jgi:peroxiredoxin